jgi:hypothetical protein
MDSLAVEVVAAEKLIQESLYFDQEPAKLLAFCCQ